MKGFGKYIVSQKVGYTTQPPAIILTVVVWLIPVIFWCEYYWVNMPLKCGLIFHLTYFVYVPYIEKL